MAKLTSKAISNYVQKNKPNETRELPYDDIKITIKSSITVNEKLQFIERVIDDAYLDNGTPSRMKLELAFAMVLIDMFTNIPLPTKVIDGEAVVDSQVIAEIVDTFDIVNTCRQFMPYHQLWEWVNERFEYENQKRLALYGGSTATDDAIETIAELANRGLDLVNKTIDAVEKNGLKLSKTLTPKKIEKLIDKVMEKLVGEQTEVIEGE